LKNCANLLYVCAVNRVSCANKINDLAPKKSGCESCRPSQELSNRAFVRYLFLMPDFPSAFPLRDLFDAAVRGRAVRLTCTRCRHGAVLSSHALWWLFHRKGWVDNFREVRRRCLCLACLHRRGVKVRDPDLELVDEPPTDTSLPTPSELDWKRELRRRR
jgi:hypothetical protein